MTELPIALSTGCMSQGPILDCLEPISVAGFNSVEICSLPQHFNFHDRRLVQSTARKLEDLGMVACSFHASFAPHVDITSLDEKTRRQSIEDVLVAARAAAILSARHLVIHPGPQHAGIVPPQERERRLEKVATSLSEIAGQCHEMGVQCVLQNKLPHLLFGNIPDMMWILGAMTTVQVGVCLDTGQAHRAGNLEQAVEKFGRYLRLIHASEKLNDIHDHRLGDQGHVNWCRFLGQLRAMGSCASIILEIACQGSCSATLSSARQAAQFLEAQRRTLTDPRQKPN